MKSTGIFHPDWYWAETLSGEVCFLAVGFGLGPRVAGGLLASQLNLQLRPWQPSWTFPSAKRYESLVNFGVNTPPSFVGEARAKVLVDCLGWLREEPLACQDAYDLVLYESFFPAREHLLKAHPNTLEIRPLIELPPCEAQGPRHIRSSFSSGYCIASFGGIGTPHSTELHSVEIPAAFLRWLSTQRRHFGGMEILFCAPEPFCTLLRHEVGLTASGVRLISPNRREFLCLLAGAATYIVQPGLYGPFEGYLRGLKVVLTPPMSYTQFKQSQALMGNGFIAQRPIIGGMESYLNDIGDSIVQDEPAFFSAVTDWWIARSQKGGRDELLEGWEEYLLMNSEDAAFGRLRRSKILEAWKNLPAAADILDEDLVTSPVLVGVDNQCAS